MLIRFVGLAMVFALASQSSVAAPVVYEFRGSIGQSATVFSSGTLSNLFEVGDTYSLFASFDSNQDPDSDVVTGAGNHEVRWNSGATISIQINGETYAVGDAAFGNSDRIAITGPSYGDFLSQVGQDYTNTSDFLVGNATSTLGTIDRVALGWTLWDNDGQSDILDFLAPRFPTDLDLSDWAESRVFFGLDENGAGGQLLGRVQFSYQGPIVFDSVTVSTPSAGVPTPPSVIVFLIGLLGFSIVRWTPIKSRFRAEGALKFALPISMSLTVLIVASSPSSAATVSYTFSGVLSSQHFIGSSGVFDGAFGVGDAFTIKSEFDTDFLPDSQVNHPTQYSRSWTSGLKQTFSINDQSLCSSK